MCLLGTSAPTMFGKACGTVRAGQRLYSQVQLYGSDLSRRWKHMTHSQMGRIHSQSSSSKGSMYRKHICLACNEAIGGGEQAEEQNTNDTIRIMKYT